MQEEFIKYKNDRLTEVQAKLNGYKDDLKSKYSYEVEDPQLESTQTNNALLKLAFLDNIGTFSNLCSTHRNFT